MVFFYVNFWMLKYNYFFAGFCAGAVAADLLLLRAYNKI